MKITETITLVNENKVVFGSKEITLTLNTETERVTVDTPAMFTGPVIRFHDLQETVAKLAEHKDRHDK